MKRKSGDEREQREAARAREVLHVAVPVEHVDAADERRGRLVGAIENAIANVPAKRRIERSRSGLRAALAAAAVVAVSMGSWAALHHWSFDSSNTPKSASQTEVDDRHARVHFSAAASGEQGAGPEDAASEDRRAGDSIATDAEEVARIQFGDGTSMKAGGQSSLQLLTVARGSQRVRLEAGTLDVTVPRPGAHRRKVAVVTPHAVVEVKGTVFQVQVTEVDGGTATSVAVRRGVVSVRHAGEVTEVRAGESWSSSDQVASRTKQVTQPSFDGGGSSAVPPKAGTLVAEGSFARAPHEHSAKTKAQAEAPRETSTLSEQNRLLERALFAEKAGDWNTALRLLDELRAKYPHSPLLGSVGVAKERLRKARQKADSSAPGASNEPREPEGRAHDLGEREDVSQ